MHDNFARYLKRNDGSETPSNLVFVDTETMAIRDPKRNEKIHHTLRLWCAIRVRIEGGKITRRKTASGVSHMDFWEWLESVSDEHRCTWVFAHNLGFDLTQLHFWEHLDNGKFTTKPLLRSNMDSDGKRQKSWTGKMCLEHNPAFIACRNGRKTYRFVDTCNYWPRSLESIGQDVGVLKRQMPGDNRSEREWFDYCMRDVEVIEAAICGLIHMWKRENCGVFQMTAASLSMTNFRHTCTVRTSDESAVDIVCEPNARHHEMERESYFGGRVSCFYRGKFEGRIYHLDINSLYPSVMHGELFPRRYVRTETNISVSDLAALSKIHGVVARVAIRTPHDTYPVRVDGEQYHCVGRFWTTLCGPELSRAIDSNHIDRVQSAQIYSIAPLFTEWVEYWYRRKLDAIDRGDEGKTELEFTKLILNSLSGKWAQRVKKWVDQPNKIPLHRWGAWTEHDDETGNYRDYRGIAGHQQVADDGGEPMHSFPLISAYITAYGREKMRNIINLCPAGSVLYMATDSLICTEEAYETLDEEGIIGSRSLGKMRVVGVHNACDIYGPNWYALDGVETATGLRGKMLRRKNAHGKAEMFEQLPGIISRGPVSDVIVTEMAVGRIHPQFRGEIGDDGYWIPYRISLDPDFSDRPPKLGYSYCDSPDTEGDRIRPIA